MGIGKRNKALNAAALKLARALGPIQFDEDGRLEPLDVVKHLTSISRDTGLWYLMVPEEHGGAGLSILTQVAILEQFEVVHADEPIGTGRDHGDQREARKFQGRERSHDPLPR